MINKSSKVIFGIVIFAIILVIIISFFIGAGSSDEGVIKFGFLAPLTGDVSSIGQQAKAAVEIAVDEINGAGGIDGKMIKVVYEDGKCNAKEAASAGSKLINVDGVKYIIGGGCSGETLSVAPIAEQNKVLMISPTSSSASVSKAGDYIFRNYASDGDAGKILAKKIKEDGYTKVAVIWSMNDWGQGLADVFSEEYGSLGGEIVLKESFVQGSNDLRAIITKIKASDSEAVVLFEYTSGTINFFKQKEELGLDVRIYGTEVFIDPTIAEAVSSELEGTRYVSLKSSYSEEFRQKVLDYTGDTDVQLGAPQSYDVVYLYKNAIEAVGDDTEKVKEWFYNMPPYSGESGSIKFDFQGDLEFVEYDYWEIHSGKSVLIS